MAADILTGHGLVVWGNGTQGPGIRVDGWASRSLYSGESGGIVTLESLTLIDKDVVIPVVAADDFRTLYSFGKDFGQMNVNGVIYLGCTASKDFKSQSSSAVQEVKESFEDLRVSQRKKPVNVSLAGGNGAKWQVAFSEIRFTGSDPARQTITYSLIGLIIPAKKK